MENLGACSTCRSNPTTPRAERQVTSVDKDDKVWTGACPTCRPDERRDQDDRVKTQRAGYYRARRHAADRRQGTLTDD
jgi:hypothetical protein